MNHTCWPSPCDPDCAAWYSNANINKLDLDNAMYQLPIQAGVWLCYTYSDYCHQTRSVFDNELAARKYANEHVYEVMLVKFIEFGEINWK